LPILSLSLAAAGLGFWGCILAVAFEGRTICIADAHRDLLSLLLWELIGRIRRMKYWQIPLVTLAALSASLVMADDFKTIDGKEYKNATVTRVEPDGIVVKYKSGISKLYFAELPREVQERFHYNPQQAIAYSADQAANYEVYQKQQEEARHRQDDADAQKKG